MSAHRKAPKPGITRGRARFERCKTSADAYGLAPESEGQPLEVRQIFFRTRRGRNYRALYTIRGDEVLVMHIRGPGQDLVPPEGLTVS